MPLNWKRGSFRLAIALGVAWSLVWGIVIASQVIRLSNLSRAYAYVSMRYDEELRKTNSLGYWHDAAVETAHDLAEARGNLAASVKLALAGLVMIPAIFGTAAWIRRGFVSS